MVSEDCDGVSDEGAWTTDGPHFAWAEAGPFVLEVAERRDGDGFRWGTFVRMGNVEHGVASGEAATRGDAQRQSLAAAHKWAADAARALPPMATDPVVDLHLRAQAVVDEARAKRRQDAAALAAREAQVEPSRPEPPPVDRGEPVTPPLVEWLRGRGLEDTARLVEARDAFGREKYGQPLMSHDGRDPIEDARQEFGDALQYVQRALMVGADLSPLREPLHALVGPLAKGRQSGNTGALATVLAEPSDDGGSLT